LWLVEHPIHRTSTTTTKLLERQPTPTFALVKKTEITPKNLSRANDFLPIFGLSQRPKYLQRHDSSLFTIVIITIFLVVISL